MSSRPAPGTAGYDEWLDYQQSHGQARLDEEEFRRHEAAIGELPADEAISIAVAQDLAAAVRHAVQWLDVPLVLRTVAAVIEAFDQEQVPHDDEPF